MGSWYSMNFSHADTTPDTTTGTIFDAGYGFEGERKERGDFLT